MAKFKLVFGKLRLLGDEGFRYVIFTVLNGLEYTVCWFLSAFFCKQSLPTFYPVEFPYILLVMATNNLNLDTLSEQRVHEKAICMSYA